MMKRKLPTVLIEMHHNHLTCKKSPGGLAGRASELQPFETFKKGHFCSPDFRKPVKKFLICLAFKCINCPKSMRRHLICVLFWFSVILMHFVIIHFCRLQSDSYNIPRVRDTLFALVTVWHVGGHATCRICRRDLVWKSVFSCYDTEMLSYFNLCSRDFLWLII